jgi:hypothetical protein
MDATGTRAGKLAAVLSWRIATDGRSRRRQAMFRMTNALAGRAGDVGAVDVRVDVRVGGGEQAVVRGGHDGLAGRPGPMILGSLAVG